MDEWGWLLWPPFGGLYPVTAHVFVLWMSSSMGGGYLFRRMQ